MYGAGKSSHAANYDVQGFAKTSVEFILNKEDCFYDDLEMRGMRLPA